MRTFTIKSFKIIIFVKIFVGLLLLISTGCISETGKVEIPLSILHEGDIVFRRGVSIESRIVLAGGTCRNALYSHIGIAAKEENEWYIVHAVPGEPDFEGDSARVKMEPVHKFFEEAKAVRGAVMRVNCDSMIASKVAHHAVQIFRRGTAFDRQYDIKDTNRLYCTEMIDYVYRTEGIDLVEGRFTNPHFPLFPDSVIYPQDIMECKRLLPVFRY